MPLVFFFISTCVIADVVVDFMVFAEPILSSIVSNTLLSSCIQYFIAMTLVLAVLFNVTMTLLPWMHAQTFTHIIILENEYIYY